MKGFLKVLTLLFLCLMLMMPAAYAVENSNSQTFPDVPSEHKFFAYIEAIYAAGITTGYSDGEFKPLVNVDRGQMAAFLARALELDISNPPATPSFPDVQPDWQFYAYVEAIYEAGITTGYSDGEYKPYEIVSRGQMAAFIARALNLLDGFDVPTESSFPDVSPDFQFFPYIEAIYAEGITTGYSDGTYRPYEPVTRGQMAAFLARAFGLAYVVDFSVFESIHSTLTQNAAIAVPIEGAVIDVFTDSARTEKNLLGSATTDENGEATLFFKLSNGTYYYEATADGYEDKIGDFAVLDADKLVDIEMTTENGVTPTAPYAIEVVTDQAGAIASGDTVDGVSSSLTFTANNIGNSGNAIVVDLVTVSDLTEDIEVDVDGTTITVTLKSGDGGTTPLSTAQEVADVINANPGASALISATVILPTVIPAVQTVNLTGGENIVLVVWWSEDVELDGGKTACTLRGVTATDAMDYDNNETGFYWDNVLLWPVSDGDIFVLGDDAVNSLDTWLNDLEEAWQYDAKVADAWVPRLGD